MALSQKHQGKILVPWFCRNEWIYVYDLIYSEKSEEFHKRKALTIINMWKVRTPLLSRGVEATLVILQAMVAEPLISPQNVQMLQATAVMRFLNMCAANDDKQGTMYKVAKKNNIPDWIITIRHSLAHGNRLPSKTLLKQALEFCMRWLKTSYWDYHYNEMQDFVVSDSNIHDMRMIKYIINLYCSIVVYKYNNERATNLNDITEKSINENVKLILKDEQINRNPPIEDILQFLWNSLVSNINDRIKNDVNETVSDVVLDNISILNEPGNTKDEDHFIPIRFRCAWQKLIELLNESDILISLIAKLYNKTCEMDADHKVKYYCSFWLHEIYNGFLKTKIVLQKRTLSEVSDTLDIQTIYSQLEEESPQFKSCMNFYTVQKNQWKILQDVQTAVVNNPNSYTLFYLHSLMELNGADFEHIKNTESLVKLATGGKFGDCALQGVEECKCDNSQNVLLSLIQDIERPSGKENLQDQKQNYTDGCNWTLVEDPEIFRGCPIGVWPGQNVENNPFINYP